MAPLCSSIGDGDGDVQNIDANAQRQWKNQAHFRRDLVVDRQAIERAKSVPVSEVVRRHVPLRRAGSEWAALCPFHREKTPSFFVNDRKRLWHCFGCGAGGSGIDFLMQHCGLTLHQAVEHITGEVEPRTWSSSNRFLAQFRAAAEEYADLTAAGRARIDPDADERARSEHARAIWANALPLAGTLGERYLRQRGVFGLLPPTLRFAPALEHHQARCKAPALVAAVKDSAGRLCAIQRTYLDPELRPDAKGKALLVDREGDRCPTKLTLGSLGDGAVRLGAPDAVLGVAEGIETGLSAARRFALPVWVSLGMHRLKKLWIPDEVTHVVVFADAGESAMKAAIEASDAYEDQGKSYQIEQPPNDFKDFNDWDAATAPGRRRPAR